MNENDVIMLAGVAVGGLLLYNALSGRNDTPSETAQAFSQQGYNSGVMIRRSGVKSTYVDTTEGAGFMLAPGIRIPIGTQTNTRLFFDEGNTLNFAQKVLLSLGTPLKTLFG